MYTSYLTIAYFVVTLIGLFYHDDIKIASRYYSTYHAFTAVCMSLGYMYTENDTLFVILLKNSAIYLLYDTFIMYSYLRQDYTMYAHHILFGMGLILFQHFYPYYVAFVLLTETSTIPLNISWYYNKTKQTHLSEFRAYVYLLRWSFFICRILLLPYVVYCVNDCMTCVTYLISLYLLNFYWFVKLNNRCEKLLVESQFEPS